MKREADPSQIQRQWFHIAKNTVGRRNGYRWWVEGDGWADTFPILSWCCAFFIQGKCIWLSFLNLNVTLMIKTKKKGLIWGRAKIKTGNADYRCRENQWWYVSWQCVHATQTTTNIAEHQQSRKDNIMFIMKTENTLDQEGKKDNVIYFCLIDDITHSYDRMM